MKILFLQGFLIILIISEISCEIHRKKAEIYQMNLRNSNHNHNFEEVIGHFYIKLQIGTPFQQILALLDTENYAFFL